MCLPGLETRDGSGDLSLSGEPGVINRHPQFTSSDSSLEAQSQSRETFDEQAHNSDGRMLSQILQPCFSILATGPCKVPNLLLC